ncbi:MAG TPA: DUF1598 domain-containing protein [Pirellulales bacterium]
MVSIAAAAVMISGGKAQAQIIQQAVGGVAISTEGVLTVIKTDTLRDVAKMRRKALAQLPGDLYQPTKLRSISLSRLQQTIAACQKEHRPLPDDIRYLAGLQRVEYVFLDPQHHDIVLAGPAEGWVVNEQGEVVGAKNGRAVLRLEDLLVALRSADQARNGGISCSIDPTPEGMKRLQDYFAGKRTIGDPDRTTGEIEAALGQQTISVGGVPGSSHFALVMVAADHQMKRLAMNFEPSPVKDLPSYLSMLSPAKTIQTPRWWLAANYEPLLKDEDGLAWQLRGTGVKCLTEEDHFNQSGGREHTGKANPLAQKWADKMTEKFDELSAKDTIFGSLRNCMDLAVVASLIMQEHLDSKADCRLDLLMDAKQLPIEEYQVPKQVATQASFVKKGRNYIISASGGVLFQPWAVIRDSKVDSSAAAARGKVVETAKTTSWWWN